MAGKKFKQRKTDVIQDGVVYRMYKERYSVYTYTEDLPEKVIIADKIGDIPVFILDTKCLSRSNCREVILPNSIERIGSAAFSGCKELETISIPSTIRSVCYDAFERCKKLKHTTFSYGCYLGNTENPFLILHKNDRAIKTDDGEELVVEVHPETKIILSSAFNAFSPDSAPYSHIDKLILHDKLEHISSAAFSMGFYGFDYAKIKTICMDSMEGLCKAGSTIPGSAKTLIVGGEVIGENLIIPAGITEIVSECFYMCSFIKTVRFEGNISKIGFRAFHKCKNLKEVYFPKRVVTIDSSAFAECPALTKVDFYEVEKIGYAAFERKSAAWTGQKVEPTKDGLREITFRGRIGTLSNSAFSNNSMLETINGLENVESMEGDPFSGTPFEKETADSV